MIRHYLAGLLACAVALPLAWAEDVQRIDPALDDLVPAGAAVEKVLGNLQFAEGPVWVRSGGYLLFSDIPANAVMKWAPAAGLSVFRKTVFEHEFPSGIQIGTNGLTLDAQGRLIACEHGNRRVSRTEKDGTITTLADHYDGKRLNSPNDVIHRRNGDIYFTDPNSVARNNPPDPNNYFKTELGFNGLYRITAAGKIELLTKDLPYPNGLAFSPDERKLYVANTRPDKFWMVYDVRADGALANGKKFLDVTTDTADGVPDGMKIDRLGNLYATGPGKALLVISPQGKHLATIRVPEIAANCAWSDADGKTLYITRRARGSGLRIKLKVPGIRP